MSLLSPAQRAQVLKTLAPSVKSRVNALLDHIRRQGWNDAAVVRRALRQHEEQELNGDLLSVEQWVMLSRRIDPAVFARVVIADTAGDAQFLLSMLEPGYASQVRRALELVPRLPASLAAVVRDWARRQMGQARN
ncbi:MAG TPA: hypothetical protein VGC19_10910 [Rhodanobacter sp.]